MSKKKQLTKRSSSPDLIDHLIKFVFAASLIFIPLYPKFPIFNIPGTYVAIRAEDFLLAIMAVLLITRINFFKNLINKDKTTQSIIIYVLVGWF